MLTRRSIARNATPISMSNHPNVTQIAELKASRAYNLSYPTLPPTLAYRRGLSRQSLSNGIAYALPVDQAALHSKNLYRVDLRAMFQDPYRTTAHTFDEDRLLAVSSLSHRPQTAKSGGGSSSEIQQVMKKCLPSYATDNSMLRAAASFSAAGEATVSRLCSAGPRNRNLFSPSRNTLRSNLSQHIEESGHNEIQTLANGILKSLDMEIKDDFYEQIESEKESVNEKPEQKRRPIKQSRCVTPVERREQLKVTVVDLNDPETPPADPCEEITKKDIQLRLKIADMQDFVKYKSLKSEYRPEMPESARSPYLNGETNSKIWNWLTDDQVVNKFDYFMFLCAKQ